MRLLKQSTASIVLLGPFLDDTDQATLEEALTVTSFTVRVAQPCASIPADLITNGGFGADTDWTKGSGWSIAAGVATSADADSVLSQTVSITTGVAYSVVYTVSGYVDGTVTVSIGGTAGTARSSNATFTEVIIAGSSNSLIEFTAATAASLNIDNVTLTQAAISITPAASGSANDMVHVGGGIYALELSAAQLAILGHHRLTTDITGAIPVTYDFTVVPANIYDSLVSGTDQIEADLTTNSHAEPGQGAPGATAALGTKIDYLYKSWRNKKTNDGTTAKLFADDGTTVDQKYTVSKASGTVTKGEVATGP